jgi:hypothetical protein
MRCEKWHYFAFLLVLMAGLAVATSSFADKKFYPGVMCVEMYDSTPEIYYGNNYAQNSASGANWFSCPVVRDTNNSVSDWDVTINRNGNTWDAWDITLWSTNLDGSYGYYDTISVSTSDGVRSLDGDSVPSYQNGGLVFIQSHIPDSCRIHRYAIDE